MIELFHLGTPTDFHELYLVLDSEVIENCGHFSLEEKVEEFVSIVYKLLLRAFGDQKELYLQARAAEFFEDYSRSAFKSFSQKNGLPAVYLDVQCHILKDQSSQQQTIEASKVRKCAGALEQRSSKFQPKFYPCQAIAENNKWLENFSCVKVDPIMSSPNPQVSKNSLTRGQQNLMPKTRILPVQQDQCVAKCNKQATLPLMEAAH
ncbi:hypothetical protein SADUNF_Sadunf19G0072300 [Salix dunnii]|uniref:Uncharacterized protein n=1 Tax=Salix dunnii TaxID=1413687 RepID=A0A835J1P0_9ROSI|nr:hypothetical protein SADUNF_Sadunf19G0072300 [Salix dunnii]